MSGAGTLPSTCGLGASFCKALLKYLGFVFFCIPLSVPLVCPPDPFGAPSPALQSSGPAGLTPGTGVLFLNPVFLGEGRANIPVQTVTWSLLWLGTW